MEELRRKLLNDKNQALDTLRDRLIKVYKAKHFKPF